MQAKIVDGVVLAYPYGLSELRRDFPNTSFPLSMTEQEFLSYDVYPVVPRNPPAFDYLTQNCERVDPTLEGGAWVETWAVTPATPEQTAQRTAEKANEVRADRNRRLADSDWTQLPDAPVDAAAWAVYRQELRDVTGQAGFPGAVIWPAQPEN